MGHGQPGNCLRKHVVKLGVEDEKASQETIVAEAFTVTGLFGSQSDHVEMSASNKFAQPLAEHAIRTGVKAITASVLKLPHGIFASWPSIIVR
jgi:hypothetical protein